MITPDYYEYFIEGNDLRESCCRKLLDIEKSIEYDNDFKQELIRQFTFECVNDGIFDNDEQLYRGAMAVQFKEEYSMPDLWRAFK